MESVVLLGDFDWRPVVRVVLAFWLPQAYSRVRSGTARVQGFVNAVGAAYRASGRFWKGS